MKLERFTSVDELLAVAGPYLEAREAEHNLMFGLCATIRSHPEVYKDPWFIAVLDGDRVVGAAMRTPPHNVILSEMTEPVAIALADAITEDLVPRPRRDDRDARVSFAEREASRRSNTGRLARSGNEAIGEDRSRSVIRTPWSGH